MNISLKKRELIPWYFVLFFICIALVDGVMVTLALHTRTGVVTDHAYEKGIAYNKVVQAEKAQAQLGWNADITFVDKQLHVVLKNAEGKVIKIDKIHVHFSRPVHDGMDFDIAMEGDKAMVNFPMKGLWEARVYIRVGEQIYQQSKRFVVE